MKIRNGFVSNSSSSSFVVAFPKKPENSADVLEFMFGGREGGISVYDYEGLSHAQISSTVFDDISRGNAKKADKEAIVEAFVGRYHYYPQSHNVYWENRESDGLGGAWVGRLGRYYGDNIELMDELKNINIEDDKAEKEFYAKERKMLSSFAKQPKYAYRGGTDPYTNKPYDDKDIEAHEVYLKKIEEFRRTNEDYLKMVRERRETRSKIWDRGRELQEKIAEQDAQNFLDDNKGKFIFIVDYSDNDGANGCTMEHGNIFKNVPHVQISNH